MTNSFYSLCQRAETQEHARRQQQQSIRLDCRVQAMAGFHQPTSSCHHQMGDDVHHGDDGRTQSGGKQPEQWTGESPQPPV